MLEHFINSKTFFWVHGGEAFEKTFEFLYHRMFRLLKFCEERG